MKQQQQQHQGYHGSFGWAVTVVAALTMMVLGGFGGSSNLCEGLALSSLTMSAKGPVGGGGDNFSQTIFDQQAGTSVVGSSAPFTGSFVPEGNLNSLIGESLDGTWTLSITDDAGGDNGTFNQWCLLPTLGSASACDITNIAVGAQSA